MSARHYPRDYNRNHSQVSPGLVFFCFFLLVPFVCILLDHDSSKRISVTKPEQVSNPLLATPIVV